MAENPNAVLYRERLAPGIGMWIACVGVGLASFLVGAPINIYAGIIAGIVMFAVVGWTLFATSPVIEITPSVLRVGRAQIEREHVGRAYAFRGEDSRLATGPALDGRAFMCFRGWISSVVRIDITDPADPTPYWVASSRNPERIAEILNDGLPEEEE